MNCLSLNIRGIGEDYKVSWVKRLKAQHMFSYLGLQESQLSDVEEINVDGFFIFGF